jgi:hypothetical protein
VRNWYKGSDVSHIKQHHRNYRVNTSKNPITRTTIQSYKMLSTTVFTSATLLGSTLATMLANPPDYAGDISAAPSFPAEPKCQEVNIFYTCVVQQEITLKDRE